VIVKNNPTQKNKRRQKALDYLNSKGNPSERDKRDIEILERRVSSDRSEPRSIRTKKNRAAKGKQ
jgi:hypothetical protein